eukprot:TRINITY_DN8061_c0_g2_i4.p1 TRINITY_DN8061_c0_g2~~TRINITY_DN8061_c0_g2_i4.p1  ORF type:complete len:634 (+),score=70.67 TRINITY_DN8061_c0_g2_i4:812-2713(+)
MMLGATGSFVLGLSLGAVSPPAPIRRIEVPVSSTTVAHSPQPPATEQPSPWLFAAPRSAPPELSPRPTHARSLELSPRPARPLPGAVVGAPQQQGGGVSPRVVGYASPVPQKPQVATSPPRPAMLAAPTAVSPRPPLGPPQLPQALALETQPWPLANGNDETPASQARSLVSSTRSDAAPPLRRGRPVAVGVRLPFAQAVMQGPAATTGSHSLLGGDAASDASSLSVRFGAPAPSSSSTAPAPFVQAVSGSLEQSIPVRPVAAPMTCLRQGSSHSRPDLVERLPSGRTASPLRLRQDARLEAPVAAAGETPLVQLIMPVGHKGSGPALPICVQPPSALRQGCSAVSLQIPVAPPSSSRKADASVPATPSVPPPLSLAPAASVPHPSGIATTLVPVPTASRQVSVASGLNPPSVALSARGASPVAPVATPRPPLGGASVRKLSPALPLAASLPAPGFVAATRPRHASPPRAAEGTYGYPVVPKAMPVETAVAQPVIVQPVLPLAQVAVSAMPPPRMLSGPPACVSPRRPNSPRMVRPAGDTRPPLVDTPSAQSLPAGRSPPRQRDRPSDTAMARDRQRNRPLPRSTSKVEEPPDPNLTEEERLRKLLRSNSTTCGTSKDMLRWFIQKGEKKMSI